MRTASRAARVPRPVRTAGDANQAPPARKTAGHAKFGRRTTQRQVWIPCGCIKRGGGAGQAPQQKRGNRDVRWAPEKRGNQERSDPLRAGATRPKSASVALSGGQRAGRRCAANQAVAARFRRICRGRAGRFDRSNRRRSSLPCSRPGAGFQAGCQQGRSGAVTISIRKSRRGAWQLQVRSPL